MVVDRLGYDFSDKPPGKDICFGSRATIANQMVESLRTGNYVIQSAEDPPAFSKVVLAGHSVGGIIVEAAAYTFDNVDGLMVLFYSDEVVSDAAMVTLRRSADEFQAQVAQWLDSEGLAGSVPMPEGGVDAGAGGTDVPRVPGAGAASRT